MTEYVNRNWLQDGDAVTPPMTPMATEKSPRVQSTGSLMGEHIMSAEGSRHPTVDNASSVSTPPSTYSEVGMSLSPPSLTENHSHSGVFVESTSSVSSRGRRPPRLPRPIAMRNTSGGAPSSNLDYHRRVRSSGDQSFMSALTDPDSPEHVEMPQDSGSYHSLTFTGQVSLGSTDSPASILQPILTDDVPQMETTPSIDPLKKLTLSDLITENPLETEAETAILKAIEKEHATTLDGDGGSSRNLLPCVPDDAVHLFRTTNQDQRDIASTNDDDAALNRHQSVASLRRQTSQTLPAPIKPISTEEALVGLAAQMKEVHQNSAFHIATENTIRDETIPLVAREEDPLAADPDVPNNATDDLVRNANILFRRSAAQQRVASKDGDEDTHTEEDAEMDNSSNRGRPKRRRWFFWGRSSESKKTDVATGDVADEVEVKANGDEDRSGPGGKAKKQSATWRRTIQKAQLLAVAEYQSARDFFKPRTANFWKFCAKLLLGLWVPVLAASFILYYARNPLTCGAVKEDETPKCASFSWWLIFLFIRQAVTFLLARLWQLLIIDFLVLRRRAFLRFFGPVVTLLIVQSKGWPFILFFWSVMDLLLLYGFDRFSDHWLFWQDLIPVFNENNPAGQVTTDDWYLSLLICAIIVGVAVAFKRLWMGTYLGRSTYANYSKQLTKVMNDMLLLSCVANYGYELEVVSQGFDMSESTMREIGTSAAIRGWDDMVSDQYSASSTSPAMSHHKILQSEASENLNISFSSGRTPPRRKGRPHSQESHNVESSRASNGSPVAGCRNAPHEVASSLTASQRMFISQELGQWEEPTRESESDALRNISISAILQFRQALAFIDDHYPFSVTFGPAETREQCIESAQKLYDRLLLHTPDTDTLPFDTLAIVATNKCGELDPKRLKRLVRLFRPERDGNLTMLDFVTSCDKVYKSLRMLQASITNSSQIDHAFEQIVNVGFYIILGAIVLSQLGVDPIALFLSLSGIVVSFAFMIGAATASYFSGILFILCQRPYNIGDRINISDPETDTSSNGSPGWIVEKVDLYSTTARFGTTNEVATMSNGSLAKSRVINAARSPQATVYVYLKFGIDVPYKKVQVFQKTVESFVKARPREWLQMSAFRATRVEADLGYIEYVIVVQHVEAWQNIGAILKSKAELSSYCLEIAKKLDMKYTAPPLPVNLDIAGRDMAEVVGAASTSRSS